MLTNPLYLEYAGQIAELFCEGSTGATNALCRATVKTRIKNAFTNNWFEVWFLPFLDQNKFKSLGVVRVEDWGETYKIVLSGFDIVSGQQTGDIGIDGVHKGAWNSGDYNRVLEPINMKFVGLVGARLIVRQLGVNYGIVFLPGEIDPPGNGNGNGHGGGGGQGCPQGYYLFNGECIKPGGGIVPKPIPKPILQIDPIEIAGVDVTKYIVPAVIVGLAFVAYKNL